MDTTIPQRPTDPPLMKVLFLTRTFPPITGGMENQNYELSRWLPRAGVALTTVANHRGKRFLPLFLPYVLLRALFLAPRHDAVLLGDGVMAVVGWAIKVVYPSKPVLCVIHGLDVRYPKAIYQSLWVRRFLPRLDRLIAVGAGTIDEAEAHGIPRANCVFIPNGVDPDAFYDPTSSRADLAGLLGLNLQNRKVLLSTGRLAPHKGVDWFVAEVLPKLPSDVLLVVAGDGEKMQDIRSILTRDGLSARVVLLGKVSAQTLKLLYNTADLYVKPNVPVPGLLEGFGLVSLEAASCALTVIAADIEGNRYAISSGENGFLVPSRDPEAWAAKINDVLSDRFDRHAFGMRARDFVTRNLAWSVIATAYKQQLHRGTTS